MLRKNAVAILLSTFVAAFVSADDLVVTRASVSPSSVLPAATVWFSFEVRNTTDHAVALPLKYIVEITPPAGEPFIGWHETSYVVSLPQAYQSEPTLAAGETRVIDFTTGSALGVSFFRDKRLWQPGTHRFRIILSSELRDDRLMVGRVHWSQLTGAGFLTAPPLVTPAIILTVEEPKGVDAEAWKALLELPSVGSLNGPKGGPIAKLLWDKYRESRYAPYFGVVAAEHIQRTGGEGRFEVVQEILERVRALDVDAIFTDDYRIGPAFGKALKAAVFTDLASAIRTTSEARAELEAAAADVKHELTRVRVRNELRKLESSEELKAKYTAATKDQ